MGRMNKKTEHLIQNDPQIVKISAHLAIILLVCVEREQKIQYRFFEFA